MLISSNKPFSILNLKSTSSDRKFKVRRSKVEIVDLEYGFKVKYEIERSITLMAG